MKLVFSTRNSFKLNEVKSILGKKIILISLDEIGCNDIIEETGSNLKENSLLKAKFVYDRYNVNCFSEDTGLEVEVLDNMPGVLSARFAGKNSTSEKNIEKLLSLIKNETNRKAQFRTIITLAYQGKFIFIEGIVKGSILKERRGINGFGYDPVFCPFGFNKSFGELSSNEKNKISHRSNAFNKLKDLLNNL